MPVDTSQFQRGPVVGNAGVVIGAAISALLGRWIFPKIGVKENGALLGAGLSAGASLLMNKRATGQFLPDSETFFAHLAWEGSQPAETRIVLPGATAGPQAIGWYGY